MRARQLCWAGPTDDNCLYEEPPQIHGPTSSGSPLCPETCAEGPVAYVLNSDTCPSAPQPIRDLGPRTFSFAFRPSIDVVERRVDQQAHAVRADRARRVALAWLNARVPDDWSPNHPPGQRN